jgi:hypothetical protein
MPKSIAKNENFIQVCQWANTLVGESEKDKFEAWMQEQFDTRVQYLEEYTTNPTPDEEDTGGRNDVIFAVHSDDVTKFAIPRLSMGIRWIEDVLDNAKANDELPIYPKHLKDYRTW